MHTSLVSKLKVWEIIVSDKKLFVFIIDRDEDMSRCFYHFFNVDFHSTVPAANIGIFMDSSS